MLPLVSLSPDRFSLRHNQVFAGLNGVIEYGTKDQAPQNSKSLVLARFQNLASELEEKHENIGLVHGLDNFVQNLEQEVIDVRKALLYLKRLSLTDFSEELCKYSNQIYPVFEKQVPLTHRYKPFDSCLSPSFAQNQVENTSIKAVLVEISQDRVSLQCNRCLDYIYRLTNEVLDKKRILESSVRELEQLSLKNYENSGITIQYVGRKVLQLFKNHHGLLENLGEAVRRVEDTYSVRFHPYVILHVLTSAIQFRQRQLSSFLLDKAYHRIERMASDIQEAVQASISLALQMIQRYDKLMDWRKKLLDLFLDKKRQICRVRYNRYTIDKDCFLQENHSAQKSFTKLKGLTSETAETAQKFLALVRSLLHQVDEQLSDCSESNQAERDLLIQLIVASFDEVSVTETADPSSGQILVPKTSFNDQLGFNSSAFASRVHLFEIEHQIELERLLRVIHVLKVQGEVLATVNEVFSSWLFPFSQDTEKS